MSICALDPNRNKPKVAARYAAQIAQTTDHHERGVSVGGWLRQQMAQALIEAGVIKKE